jgi:hypothetical protein
VPDHVESGSVATIDGGLELGHGVEAVDLLEDLVGGDLEAELDPHRHALGESLQPFQGPVGEGVGTGGESNGLDSLGETLLDDPEDLVQPLGFDVGVRVALEVGDHSPVALFASGHSRQPAVQLSAQLEARLQRTRAGALDVAVDAAAVALGIRTGRARVESHAVERLAECLEQPGSQGSEGKCGRHRSGRPG